MNIEFREGIFNLLPDAPTEEEENDNTEIPQEFGNEETKMNLMSMGFSERLVIKAMKKFPSGNDIQIIEWILSNPDDGDDDPNQGMKQMSHYRY